MALLDPRQYSSTPVRELLDAAAQGRIGVDRRLVAAIIDRQGEAQTEAAQDTLAFSRAPQDDHRISIDPLLVDLFRHWQTPEALEFYIDAVARSAEDVSDELVAALLPFGEKAVEPLLDLYEELGEEEGGDVAFLLAGLRVRDPRILALLVDRLEFDVGDGAFCLGLYGDPAAREPLERMLAEIPEAVEDSGEVALRREVAFALEQLDSPEAAYTPEPFDILKEYPREVSPVMEVLDEDERMEQLGSPDPVARVAAAQSFFNHEISAAARERLLKAARSDDDAEVRGRAWASLADATAPDPDDGTAIWTKSNADAVRDEMVSVVNDRARETAERGGAAVGLYGVADEDGPRQAIEALYEEGGVARAKALEAMWRSLYKPFARYFPENLKSPDVRVVRQALRGAGYFELTGQVGVIESYFDRDDEFADLREDALFAYAMAMPGETKPNRMRGMLRKIHERADLLAEEADLVMFALDERLRMHGQKPVFDSEDEEDGIEVGLTAAGSGESLEDIAAAVAEEAAAAQNGAGGQNGALKVGRNDPCPCGSGKKYKKCHGA